MADRSPIEFIPSLDEVETWTHALRYEAYVKGDSVSAKRLEVHVSVFTSARASHTSGESRRRTIQEAISDLVLAVRRMADSVTWIPLEGFLLLSRGFVFTEFLSPEEAVEIVDDAVDRRPDLPLLALEAVRIRCTVASLRLAAGEQDAVLEWMEKATQRLKVVPDTIWQRWPKESNRVLNALTEVIILSLHGTLKRAGLEQHLYDALTAPPAEAQRREPASKPPARRVKDDRSSIDKEEVGVTYYDCPSCGSLSKLGCVHVEWGPEFFCKHCGYRGPPKT